MSTTRTLASEHLRRGYQLGEYTLLELIGRGGEAVIWSGWDNRQQRIVALKIMPSHQDVPPLMSPPSGDFERQVHLLTTLEHPHILPLYEFDVTDAYYFFVMRYNPAGSLASRLMAGPLPLAKVLYLSAQIISALTYLHDRGIVHRDLKPSNILLDSQDRVYLADFGLAKRLTEETALLHTGRGTGPYAPFEQVAHYTVTPQSDIYSLGILIYEMLTGQLPWRGSASLAVLQRQDNEVLPDPREFNPDLPSSLVDVLRRLTAFHWRDRPESAAKVFDLLVEALPGEAGDELLATRDSLATLDEDLLAAQDTHYLLSLFLPEWEAGAQEFPARLTHLAYVDVTYRRDNTYPAGIDESKANRFMLRGALAYDYHLDYWWQAVSDPQVRRQVCVRAIASEPEAVVGRVLARLLNEPEGTLSADEYAPLALERLIDLATSAGTGELRRDALQVLERLTPQGGQWRPVALTRDSDTRLAALALAGSSAESKQVARIIGHLRSETAVQVLLEAPAEEEGVLDALHVIQEAAGSLPRSVPVSVWLRLLARRLRRQLLEDREGVSIARVLIGLGAGTIAGLMLVFGFFSQQAAQTRDVLIAPYPVSGIVTIVEVNDASLQRHGRWGNWPRTLHAELIDRLHAAGARTIVLDFVFDAATPEDSRLAEAMRQAGNVIQPVVGQGDALRLQPDVLFYEDRLLPQSDLLAASAAIGHTNVLHEADGYVRRVPTVIAVDGERYATLALTALQNYLGVDPGEATAPIEAADGWLQSVGRRIPIEGHGEMSIHYAGPPAQPGQATFAMVSYQDVLDGAAPIELLKDKIVLVGITATAEPDRYLTPVSDGRPMYGVEILANVVEAIWSGRFIRPVPEIVQTAILLLLGVLVGSICVRPWSGFILAASVALLYFVVAASLFDLTGIMLDLFFPGVVIALSYVAVTAYRFSIEISRRRDVQ